jgi:hypothetical protein
MVVTKQKRSLGALQERQLGRVTAVSVFSPSAS